jgi:alpha-glucosidase (family GH31 glycosyl hydrolase)
MWLEFPKDRRFRNNYQQFMLGDKLLVAPVIEPQATSKTVVLPEGCWTYGIDEQNYQGPQTVVVSAPLKVLPYFYRCGGRVL